MERFCFPPSTSLAYSNGSSIIVNPEYGAGVFSVWQTITDGTDPLELKRRAWDSGDPYRELSSLNLGIMENDREYPFIAIRARTDDLDAFCKVNATYLGRVFTGNYEDDQPIKKIYALPIEWSPGDKWGYRNTNYVILGILIHKITGEGYDQFLHDRIFAPLCMTSTRLISDRDIIKNRSSGYKIDDTGQLKNQEWVSPTFNSTADGSLYFNVLDLAKWDEALYTTRLLTQVSLDRIWTVYPLNNGKPNPGNYGFGWDITQFHGHKLIEHGGAWQGFTCDISRYPDDSLTVVVLTNLDEGHSRPALIAHVVAGVVEPPLMPAKLAPIPTTIPLSPRLSAHCSINSSPAPMSARRLPPTSVTLSRPRVVNGCSRLSRLSGREARSLLSSENPLLARRAQSNPPSGSAKVPIRC
jgi:Beta-lactamase